MESSERTSRTATAGLRGVADDVAPRRHQGATPAAIAWVDGEIMPATDATIPLLDEGFLRGDAVFEVVPMRHGRTHGLAAHLARLARSAAALGLDLPDVRPVVAALLAAWPADDGALKVIVTRSGTIRGIVDRVSWPETLDLAVVEMPWRTAISGVKTLSYAANQWATRHARDLGADDALIVDSGIVMELPTGAIGVVRDGVVSASDPALLPVLDSVTMRALADVVDVHYTTIRLDELLAADELFVVSATRPVLGVGALYLPDGGVVDFAATGPVSAAARSSLDEHMRATLDPRDARH